MLIETMTTDELRNALMQDIPWLAGYVVKFKNAMTREQRRSKNRNGRYSEWCRHPKSKNEWVLAGYYSGKSREVYPYCYYQGKEGGFLIRLFAEGYFLRFTPHFFVRYQERMGLKYKDTRKIISYYVRRTIDGHLMPQSQEEQEKADEGKIYRFFNVVHDGIGLGDCWPNEKIYNVRTFVSNDLLFQKQEDLREHLIDRMNEAFEKAKAEKDFERSRRLAIQLRSLLTADLKFVKKKIKELKDL